MLDFENHKNSRVRQAYKIAQEAHKHQKDKAGADYINHPMMVASNVGNDVSAIILALLHDVIEDHSDKYNFNILKHEVHLSVCEMEALKLLTIKFTARVCRHIFRPRSNFYAAQVERLIFVV